MGDNFLELPFDVKGLAEMEDVSISFNENRYFLSKREKEVFENICRMRKVNQKLTELNIRYLNATMLYGESGTGKTTFGRYVAYKMGLPFCAVKFSGLINSYMGSTAKNIKKGFD